MTDWKKSITVYGESEVKITPNQVILGLGIETVETEIDLARENNNSTINSIIKKLIDFGIERKCIQTDHIEIKPEYKDGWSGNLRNAKKIGYCVRKSLLIVSDDIKLAEPILAEAFQLGATHLNYFEFRTTELKKFRNEARKLAIQHAREKASVIVSELNKEIGEPLKIEEEKGGERIWNLSLWGYSGALMRQPSQMAIDYPSFEAVETTSESSIAPGQLSIRAKVKVEFEIV